MVVLPAVFDFGIVTGTNTAQSLEVKIQNDGTAPLDVSGITLLDTDNFALDVTGGSSPCNSTSPPVGVGDSCTVNVAFTPQSIASFTTTLQISSNDSSQSVFDLSLAGSKQAITALNVTINQIEACPRPDQDAVVYVSVTDQGGFPVADLVAGDFSLQESGAGFADTPTTAPRVGDVGVGANIAVALVLDYSFSVRSEPDNVTDMERSAIAFVKQLGLDDEAEIIKYGIQTVVAQEFTSDPALLTAAIERDIVVGDRTALFAAVTKAVNDTAARLTDRRAVIIISDGRDTNNNPADLTSAINHANTNGVPVFTVGLGTLDIVTLGKLAEDTGGIFSDSTVSDNLPTIFNQLANLLFANQYVLTYTSGIDGADDTSTLTVDATLTSAGLTGSNIRTIPACP
jgi:Ca-activated chloride channel family protein